MSITSNEVIKNSKCRFLRLSSEDKSTGNNTRFTVDIGQSGGIIDNVSGFIVHSIECPNTFNNVSSYNNTLEFYAGASAQFFTAVIPTGYYLIDDLITTLQNVLDPIVASASMPSVVTVSKVGIYPNEKINFLFAGDDWYLLKNSTLKAQIGLGDDDFGPYPFGGGSFPFFDGINTLMPNIPNLIGETAVYVHSRTLAPNHLVEGSGSFSVVDKLNLDEPFGSVCYSNFNNDSTHFKKYFPFETLKSIRTIDIVLRNRTGNVLEMPSNFDFTMMVTLFYK
jgi:hypothetical protein